MAEAFTLELPTEEEVREQLVEEIKVPEKTAVAITSKVESTTEQIMNVDLADFAQRKEVTSVIEGFGLQDINSCRTKNQILNQRIGTFQKQGGETGQVATGLAELTLKMKDLDPSGIDFVNGKVGKLFNPVRKYFQKFETADHEIDQIVKSLEAGRKVLTADNTTLELEETNLRQLCIKMQQHTQMGMELDASVSAAIERARAEGIDPDKIKFVEEEILYPLRQRIEDFQQIMLVSQQGIISMELIRRNNKELIRSVDRAENVTVTALRTAVTVAGALYNQKIVLEKVTALNQTTNHMLETTAKMLHQQGVAIQKQASETAISVDALQTAFDETFAALDEISTYRQEALPRMRETIEQFALMAETGEKRIQQMEKSGVVWNQ